MKRNLIIQILIICVFLFYKNGIVQGSLQRNVKYEKGDLLQYQLGDIKERLMPPYLQDEFERRGIDFNDDYIATQMRESYNKQNRNIHSSLKKDIVNCSNDFLTSQLTDSVYTAMVAYYSAELIPSNDYAGGIAIDVNENVYVTGNSDSSLTGYDYPIAITVNALANIYVAGNSTKVNRNIYTIIKYKQVLISADAQPELLPELYSLSQNFPDPFNPVTTIIYQLPVNSKVSLKIYDIFYQEVKIFVDDIQAAGYKSVNWNSTNNPGNIVSSGVYFYRIEATSITGTS